MQAKFGYGAWLNQYPYMYLEIFQELDQIIDTPHEGGIGNDQHVN